MLTRQKRPLMTRPALPLQTRAAMYLRVSTDEQARSGLGLADQRARGEAMAQLHGWDPPRAFLDEGVSGTKDERKRAGLRALLAAVAAGEVDVVIISEFSRLARTTRLLLSLFDTLSASGVQLISCKESLDTQTPAGRFALTMLAAVAELERDNIAERTRGALEQRAKTAPLGRLPYAYVRLTPSGVGIDRAQARVARSIIQRRRAGCTLQALADDLTARGVPAPRGARWYASSVREVLLNEAAYRGGPMGATGDHWPRLLPAEPQR